MALYRLLADIVLEAFGFIPFVVNFGNSMYNRNGRETLSRGCHIYVLLHINAKGVSRFRHLYSEALRVKAYHKR